MNLIPLNKPLTFEEVTDMHLINQENIPEVGDVSNLEDFQLLVDLSEFILAFKDNNRVIGFILLMREGNKYHSENYKYMSSRFDKFLYIDRIAIQKNYRRRGLGEKIYSEVISKSKKLNLDVLCEVNTRPRNDPSIAFHKKMGFEEIGTNDFEKNSVVYLKRSSI